MPSIEGRIRKRLVFLVFCSLVRQVLVLPPGARARRVPRSRASVTSHTSLGGPGRVLWVISSHEHPCSRLVLHQVQPRGLTHTFPAFRAMGVPARAVDLASRGTPVCGGRLRRASINHRVSGVKAVVGLRGLGSWGPACARIEAHDEATGEPHTFVAGSRSHQPGEGVLRRSRERPRPVLRLTTQFADD